MTQSTTDSVGDIITEFVTAPVRPATYKRLAYLLLAFPLGIAYFVGLTAGASTGIGMAVTIVGVPILIATLVGSRVASKIEAYLARSLLNRRVPAPAALEQDGEWSFTDPDDGYLNTLKSFLTATDTWTSVGVVFIKFLYGHVAFVATVTAGSLVVTLLAAPFVYDSAGVTYQFGSYVIDTFPESMALFGTGVVGLFVALNLLNRLADLGGLLTERVLCLGRSAYR